MNSITTAACPAMNATYAVNPANFAASLLVNLGTTEPTTAAPVTIGGVQYTSGTQLFFEDLLNRNVTSWSVVAGGTSNNASITFTFNVDRAFTTAEQTAAAADNDQAGSWRRASPVVLYEGDTLNVADATQRRLWVHVSNTTSRGPTFTNNGETVSWVLYGDGGDTSFSAAWPNNFINTVSSFNAEFISQELIDAIPFTESRFSSPTVISGSGDTGSDETLATNPEWVTKGGAILATELPVTVGTTPNLNPTATTPVFTEDSDTRSGLYFFGEEPPHWLRDEQEKIIIWMALVHIFDYLGEMEMMQKYLQKAQAEMQQLNLEEGRRRVTGGNTQQNFNGFLI